MQRPELALLVPEARREGFELGDLGGIAAVVGGRIHVHEYRRKPRISVLKFAF
jgi:hypothetical protein